MSYFDDLKKDFRRLANFTFLSLLTVLLLQSVKKSIEVGNLLPIIVCFFNQRTTTTIITI
jgi:hypothetical protein